MIYRDHEIYARVAGTYNELYETDEYGNASESVDDFKNTHGDEQVIWYEVEAIDVDHKPFPITTTFTEIKTIDEAKKIIDRSADHTDEQIAADEEANA